MAWRWRALKRRPENAWLAPIAVALIGLGLSATAYVQVRNTESRIAADKMARISTSASEAASAEAERYVDTLDNMAGAIGAQTSLSQSDFDAITAPLQTERLKGATGLRFIVTTNDANISQVQAYWRAQGATGLTLTPNSGTSKHYFVVLNRNLDGTPSFTGRDLAGIEQPQTALEQSLAAGGAIASEPYVLLRDRSLPRSNQQLSFVITTPVYAPDHTLRGWLLLGMRSDDFLTSTIAQSAGSAVKITLSTVIDNEVTTVATAGPTKLKHPLVQETQIGFAQTTWTLTTFATKQTLLDRYWDLVEGGVGALGIIITTLIAVIIRILMRSRAVALAKVERATAELRENSEQLAKQKKYLNTVINSVEVAVVACETSGKVVFENDYSKQLGASWFNAPNQDGVSALSVVLEEGQCNGFESTSTASRERTVLVHGRTLNNDDGTVIGVVLAGHDITALRKNQAELAAFAAMAAHDLKSPLAAVICYVQLMVDHIAESVPPDADTLSHMIERVDTVATRMNDLIDDLLALAKARDSELQIQRVPLDRLVSAVVNRRLEHLEMSSSGQELPTVDIGLLPDVEGDERLLAQLFDNLIGNAFRYVAAGVTPEVKIAASSLENEFVTITVSDNGIGIPVEQREMVFRSFFRGRKLNGQAGTGLGLAICERVVDRHGGTIWISDNQPAGTRFSFTLPVASDNSVPALPATARTDIPLP